MLMEACIYVRSRLIMAIVMTLMASVLASKVANYEKV